MGPKNCTLSSGTFQTRAAGARLDGASAERSLRTDSGSCIKHVLPVTYIFNNCAHPPPISSAVLNRLSRALRGRDRMAIACAPVLPAPSEAVRAAIAGAPEAPASRDPRVSRPRKAERRLSEADRADFSAPGDPIGPLVPVRASPRQFRRSRRSGIENGVADPPVGRSRGREAELGAVDTHGA